MGRQVLLELVRARVRPADIPWEEGIPSRDSTTLPFRVERAWSGPAGNYVEEWSIRKGFEEIVYRAPAKEIFVRGMQSVSEYVDAVDRPLQIEPGNYLLVFVVDGFFMGSVEIQVVPTEEAAA